MTYRHYPLVERDPAEAFGLETLARLTALVLSWRQGAGEIGGLHLHECWEDGSVLARGYHGSSSTSSGAYLSAATTLARKTGDPAYYLLADGIASQLLWQQDARGGFIHASSEYEPTYTREESCPIAQCGPWQGLFDYCESLPAGAPARRVIAEKAERHFEWFCDYWWKRGNAYTGPLDFPGYCGVTNQDLEAVAALARYGQVCGDMHYFEEQGLPVLETFLSPLYFHEDTGLFERGDRAQFTERCVYMIIIADMLRKIEGVTGDERLARVRERIADVMAEAVHTDEQGRCRLAWGVDDAATAREGRRVWDRSRVVLTPGFIRTLGHHEEEARAVEAELARYVFADGSMASIPNPAVPLFAVAPSASALCGFWKFLVERHAEGPAAAELPAVPVLKRSYRNLSFTSSAAVWMIHDGDRLVYRGVKSVPHGVLAPGQDLPNYRFPELELEVVETIEG